MTVAYPGVSVARTLNADNIKIMEFISLNYHLACFEYIAGYEYIPVELKIDTFCRICDNVVSSSEDRVIIRYPSMGSDMCVITFHVDCYESIAGEHDTPVFESEG